ncbi:MAG: peptidase Do [Candidatus Accumulibacter sp. SK-11]|nr:MAG: peptidase Do [Candidatus Accumulibacter sp. SK-11]
MQLEDDTGGQGGVRVLAVTAGSLAERSGLAAGDRLLEVGGRPAITAAAVISLVRAAAPGTWLPLRLRRGETTLEIVIRFPPE